jgi:alpha-L-fucosidase
VFDWPSDGKLTVPDVPGEPQRAMLLEGRQALELTRQDRSVLVSLPPSAPDAIATVVVLELAKQ